MSEGAALTERYDPASHEVAEFACGEESLDRWLHRYAGQGERRDATRTLSRPTSMARCVASLAVDERSQGQGLGASLLSDAV